MRNLLFFTPEEYLVLMVAAAGLAMVIGARRFAGTLLVAALVVALLPFLLDPLLDVLPGWVLVGLLLFFGLAVLRVAFELFIGRNSTDHMVGTLAADVVRAVTLAPFRLIGWALRGLWQRHRDR